MKTAKRTTNSSKVNCPFCSFAASSHGSMIVHFGFRHPDRTGEFPSKSEFAGLENLSVTTDKIVENLRPKKTLESLVQEFVTYYFESEEGSLEWETLDKFAALMRDTIERSQK